MADQNKTIHKTTGDYSTVQSWADAADLTIDGDGYWQGEIQDAALYTEAVDIDTVVGTPTIDNYVWLTVASGVRHSGFPDTTHARMSNTTTNSVGTLNIELDFTRVEWLEVHRNADSTGDAGTVFIGANVVEVLVSHCVITGVGGGNAKDVVECAGGNIAYIDNCAIAADAATQGIFHRGDTVADSTVYIDHCSVRGEFTGIGFRFDGAATGIWHLYNNLCIEEVDSDAIADMGTTFNRGQTSGTQTFNGSNNQVDNGTNIDGTDNLTGTVTSTNFTTTTTATDAAIVTDDTDADINFVPKFATGAGVNEMLEAGVDRIGSEPDPRQDFALDCAGNTRFTTNVDIGALQISLEAVIFDQEGFRFRTDSGNESTPTWEAAQDTVVTMPAAVTKGLRSLVDFTGDPPTGKPKQEYRKVGDADSEWEPML